MDFEISKAICKTFNAIWPIGTPVILINDKAKIEYNAVTCSMAWTNLRDKPIIVVGCSGETCSWPLSRVQVIPESWRHNIPNTPEEIEEQRERWAVIAGKLPKLEANTLFNPTSYTPCAECEAEKIHPRGSVNNE